MLEMMCLKEKSLSLWRDNAHSSYLSKNALTVLPALNLYLRLATTKSELNPIENPLECHQKHVYFNDISGSSQIWKKFP